MPGLAPQVETAVVPPGLLCLAASSVSRSDGVDVKRADFPAHRHDVDRRRIHRQVDAKALTAAGGE
jgi:hypothetical protein